MSFSEYYRCKWLFREDSEEPIYPVNMVLENDTVTPRTEKVIAQDIERLKEWLSLQPHLPHDVGEDLLSSFVHGTSSLEIAKQKLDAFFSWRGQVPQFFGSTVRDPTDPYFRRCSRAGEVFFLPSPTPEGYRVLFFSLKETFENFYDHDLSTATWFMTLELAMILWPEMRGVYIIGDMSCFTIACLKKLSLASIETAIRCFLDCYPLKLKRATAFNAHPMFDSLCNTLMKPLLPEKLFKRITITSEDKSCLKKYIPEELLPSNYGGSEKPTEELYENWLEMLVGKKDWFEETSQWVADETKRLRVQDHYGIEGTFRRLSID